MSKEAKPEGEAARVPVELWTDEDWDRWRDECFAAGLERVRADVREMQEKGILDENGERIRKELPPAMLSGDKPDDVA